MSHNPQRRARPTWAVNRRFCAVTSACATAVARTAKKSRGENMSDKLAPKGQTGGFAAKLQSEIAAI